MPDADARDGHGTLLRRPLLRSVRRRTRRVPAGARSAAAASPHDPARWADLVRWVPDAPVLVSVTGGLGLRGAPALVAPVLRGVVVQLVHALPPDDLRIASRPAGPEWDWLQRLPHAADGLREERAGADRPATEPIATGEPGAWAIRLALGGREVVLAAAPLVESLPAACRTVLDVRRPGTARILAATRRRTARPPSAPRNPRRPSSQPTATASRCRASPAPAWCVLTSCPSRRWSASRTSWQTSRGGAGSRRRGRPSRRACPSPTCWPRSRPSRSCRPSTSRSRATRPGRRPGSRRARDPARRGTACRTPAVQARSRRSSASGTTVPCRWTSSRTARTRSSPAPRGAARASSSSRGWRRSRRRTRPRR